MLFHLSLGAIQIIRDTFLAYFRPPPSPMCHLVTLARTGNNRVWLYLQKQVNVRNSLVFTKVPELQVWLESRQERTVWARHQQLNSTSRDIPTIQFRTVSIPDKTKIQYI